MPAVSASYKQSPGCSAAVIFRRRQALPRRRTLASISPLPRYRALGYHAVCFHEFFLAVSFVEAIWPTVCEADRPQLCDQGGGAGGGGSGGGGSSRLSMGLHSALRYLVFVYFTPSEREGGKRSSSRAPSQPGRDGKQNLSGSLIKGAGSRHDGQGRR